MIDDEAAAKCKGGRKGGKNIKRLEDDQVKLSFPHKFMSSDEVRVVLVCIGVGSSIFLKLC